MFLDIFYVPNFSELLTADFGKTKNPLFFHRGTKDFIVSIGDTSLGPWREIANGTFPDLRPDVGTWSPVKVNLTVVKVEPPSEGRFVKYECTSMYGDACALHYVGLVQLRTMQAAPEPQGIFDQGRGGLNFLI